MLLRKEIKAELDGEAKDYLTEQEIPSILDSNKHQDSFSDYSTLSVGNVERDKILTAHWRCINPVQKV
jgi:hypothetical protein